MNKRKIIKLMAIVSGISGITILLSSVWPIIEYQLTDARAYTTLLSPLVLDKADYTKASSWFPETSKNKKPNDSKVSFYTISM